MKRTGIRKKSKKQNSIDRELKKVYSEMALEREHYCTGCGTTEQLTHSHLIPRSRRRDLITDPNNIQYHCLSCHVKWEDGVLSNEMSDYEVNMEYLLKKDNEYYNIKRLKLHNKTD
jgi:5-methylcytosine-specific restriction endonuclease McrA